MTDTFKWNRARPESLAMRVGARVRTEMFGLFMRTQAPGRTETVLDIGVTSDQSHLSTNYFEDYYPWKDRITAVGLENAGFLEERHPGLRFVLADARSLPFRDGSFDLVHSSAVLEHVGARADQARMIAECLRVARRGIYLTTPNRWFPIEFHTQIPLLHWLPKPVGRAALRLLGMEFFSYEANLNLMTERELRHIAAKHREWSFQYPSPRVLGWPSNLILVGRRNFASVGPVPSG